MEQDQRQPLNFRQQGRQPQHHSLICVGDNLAFQMCLNEKCKSKNVFQCSNQTCQCKKLHQNCQKGDFKPAIKMVYSKIYNTGQIRQAIDQLIYEKTNQLTGLRQKLINIVDTELQYIRLDEIEKKFYALLKGEGQIQKFTPTQSKNIWQWSKIETWINKSWIKVKINSCIKEFDNKISESITQSWEKLLLSIDQMKKNKNQLDLSQKLQLNMMTISKIVTTEQLATKFVNLFERKINLLQRLFCASQNNFSMKKCLDVCDRFSNTIVICKTNKDKIIGRYIHKFYQTPLWQQFLLFPYPYDNGEESFIFSLTDGQKSKKYIQKKLFLRVISLSNKQICFGRDQLKICDKSNINPNCLSKVNCENRSYKFPAYSSNDKEAWLKFNGNESPHFTTKEWQVWKVELEWLEWF